MLYFRMPAPATCTTSGMSSPSRTMAIRRWAAKPIGSATPGYSSCSRR